MKVTYANQPYDCKKAIRQGNKVILHLIEGGLVEFGGVSPTAIKKFVIEDGDWEIINIPTSLEERMDSLEGTMKEIMIALINLQK